MGFFNDSYKDPLTIEWFDNSIPHTDTLKVVNGRFTLTYVPDEFQGLVISGYVEIKTGTPSTGQFIVNYTNGVVTFNKDVVDGTSLSPEYYARGIIQYPSQRIILQDTENLFESDNAEDAFREVMKDVKTNNSDNNSRMTQIEQDRIDEDQRLQGVIETKETESVQRDNDLGTRVDNIVSQAGTDNTEIVDLRLGADGVARPVAGDLVREIHDKQLLQDDTKQVLTHGTQVINGSQASPLKVEFYGQSRINYQPDGNFENQGKWRNNLTIDSTTSKFGSTCGKIDNSTGTGNKDAWNDNKLAISGKYILIPLWMKSASETTTVNVRLYGYDSSDTYTQNLTQTFVIDNTWKMYYVKFDLTTKTESYWKNVIISTSWGTANDVVFVDGLLVEELTSEQYNAIGVSKTDADVIREHSFITGIQSVKNPVLRVSGKNLFDGQLELGDIYSSNGGTTDSTTDIRSVNFVEILPSQKYMITLPHNKTIGIRYYDRNKSFLGSDAGNSLSELTFTSPSNCRYTRFVIRDETDINFKVQIELGDKATPYVEHNNSYIIAETTLAGLPNSDKKDILRRNEDKNRWEKQKWFEQVTFNGIDYNWTNQVNYTGSKQVTSDGIFTPNAQGEAQKYDGSILDNEVVGEVDKFFINGSGEFRITVSNNDTGFTDGMTPTNDDWSRYFNGWKYVDGTTWESIVDGTETTGASEALSTSPSSYENYFLLYELAEPEIIENIRVEGSVSIDGLAQAEVSSGIVWKEEANPYQYDSTATVFINRISPDHYKVSQLKHKVGKIIEVRENGNLFTKYRIESNDAYGNEKIAIEPKNYNPDATYTVTYEPLEKYNMTCNIKELPIWYNKSLPSTVADVVTIQSDQGTAISILDRSYYDMLKRIKKLEQESGV